MSGANLDQAIGRILGERYQLLSRIGTGASAEVYQATDLRLDRRVAVKQLRPNLTEDARFAKLFRSEAHLAAQLSHPNILTVFDWSADVDGEDGGAYIVTELLSGGTLRNVLDVEGTVSLSQAAFIGLQAARGLAFAHEHGLVHRDIKPANLLFGSDGRIHIGDFGIARAVAQAAWTEPEGVLIGTARYAAPEQATAGPVDGLVDVYSLTICLMEALTGQVPLVQENAIGTMMLRQEQDLPIDGSYGVLAEPLSWAGLADPDERATAAELREALLVVCRTMPDPDPLALVDLRGNGATARPSLRPNVRIDDDGQLIIEGEDSDLALPSPDGAGDGPLNGWTSDDYLTVSTGPIRPRGRRLAALVVLFALLAAGALLAGRQIGQSRQPELESISLGLPSYPVADYRGMTPAEVQDAVAGNRWSVSVSEEYADGTEAGDLLSQVPEAGESMAPGGRVELLLSLGPQPRVVPEMVGLAELDARRAIERANLVVGTVTEQPDEDSESGIVLEAAIDGVPAQPGSRFLTGTAIDLLVSSGPAPREVPPLKGLTVEQARIELQNADLVLGTAEAYSESVAEGLIIGLKPAAGASVPRGATVTVTVSLGRPFVTVPDLIGRPVSEAIDELKAQGFSVAINGTVGSTVIASRPVPGESVRSGSEIEIISSN